MQDFELLEARFRKWIGEEWDTVAVSSGTAALHVGLEALELPLDSKILVPDYCMYAIPRAVVLAGHVPVFADCYSQNLNIDIDRAVRGLGQINCEEIKAVVVAHNFGRRAFMEGIHEVAQIYKWKVIEDLAEAHGVNPHPKTDVACWSFYQNKIIAGEEGGMIAFKGRELTEVAKSLRCLGFTEHHNFWHRPRGVNARLSNACARLILPSLFDVKDNLKKRKALEVAYDQLIPTKFKMLSRDVAWVYDVRLPGSDFEMLGKIVGQLRANGVESREGFKSNSFQVEFKPTAWGPESYLASQEVMYLPIRSNMEVAEVSRNVAEFIKAVDDHYL